MWLAFSIRQKLMFLVQVTSQQTPTFLIYICVITLGSLFCVTVTETGFRIHMHEMISDEKVQGTPLKNQIQENTTY